MGTYKKAFEDSLCQGTEKYFLSHLNFLRYFKMRNNLILFAIILIFWACSTNGECPNINSIPVMNEDDTNFVCAQIWDAPGSVTPIEGCNTAYSTNIWYKGLDLDVTECCYIPMGSVIVKAGCTLYAWEVITFHNYF